MSQDDTLSQLLALDGERFTLEIGFFVKLESGRVEITEGKPHDFKYSLSLHQKDGTRIFAIKNVHAVAEKKGKFSARMITHDHQHIEAKDPGRPYEFSNPRKLLEDFWTEADYRIKAE